MASTNDGPSLPPKPRISPFDYRNTDLVSRLLAATPPYLYNMPLVPHTFFFSEMLRSLVQSKAENAIANAPSSAHHHHYQRKTRKRPWSQINADYAYHGRQEFKASQPMGMTAPVGIEAPNDALLEKEESTSSDLKSNSTDDVGSKGSKLEVPAVTLEKQQPSKPSFFLPPQPSEVVPPFPPAWYPPMYPSPYVGVDPLHFFIDLRVSGHIYDRKKAQRVGEPFEGPSRPPSASGHCLSRPERSTSSDAVATFASNENSFKSSRHSSAFSLPSSLASSMPINLSNHSAGEADTSLAMKCITKFDVKSLGLEKCSNKTGTNYLMSNISNIYKHLQDLSNGSKLESSQTFADDEESEEKKKRDKDLRALIGLELVVDYMSQARPALQSKSNVDDGDCGSFSLKEDLSAEDVVDVTENESELDNVQW